MDLAKNPLLEGLEQLEEISKKWSNVKNPKNSASSQTKKSDPSVASKENTPSSDKSRKEKKIEKSEPSIRGIVQETLKSNYLSNDVTENTSAVSTVERENEIAMTRPKTRNYFPQIIDEDTEQFKIRLEHLLNVFKSDAISEFMAMKKGLLEEQLKSIKKETDKYLKMYEQKYQEVIKIIG